MSVTLDYEAPQPRWRPSRRVGLIAARLSAAVALLIFYGSTAQAQSAHVALMSWGGCGTGRRAAEAMLLIAMPLTLIAPACGWGLAQWAGAGISLARCSMWVALLSWTLSALSVVFRWEILEWYRAL